MVGAHHSRGVSMYTTSQRLFKHTASSLRATAPFEFLSRRLFSFVLLALPHGEDLQEIVAGEQACLGTETGTLFLLVADAAADGLPLMLQLVTLLLELRDCPVDVGVGLLEEVRENFNSGS